MKIMRCLEVHFPRLVGPVLSGNATDYSAIDLHVFNDSAEAVAVTLDELRINHRTAQFSHRFRRGQVERFPGYRFANQEFEFSVTVFPERRRRHAPLSPVDGKPMHRADIRAIERLLDPQRLLISA